MWTEFAEHWQVYLSMPVVAAVIGYLTKRAAIEMMFRPVDFVGVPPYLGWQGVVPRNSERMIAVAADLLTAKLVDPREIVQRLDPARLAAELELPLLLAADETTREVLTRQGLWQNLPPLGQELVIKRVQASIPDLVARVMAELSGNIKDILDIKSVAVNALHRDKRLLLKLIRDISRPEMAFIARCGVYFGLFLGLVQTVVWALTKAPLVMPVFGAAVGWFTDWLAIKLVFFPRERRKVLGVLPLQGVFQRRRDEVAKQYATVIAREVMTVPNLVNAILTGPGAERLQAMVRETVEQAVEEQAGLARPLLGPSRFTALKKKAAEQAVRYLPTTMLTAETYATEALDIRDTIATKMRRLSRVEYEGLLRPAFRQDEWKLIAVGAAIGALIGELQVLLLLH
ncbi:DUF445 domain-containing protein [Actinophytocola oryzae]|uniref:DUF445 domain-containing protein n=1 Tax=Actinophytocola oryzae TaxID=502181 RepID=A0A4R7UW62_9PSEU|nr:DUF445 domain-containing protein [Actinophytocola oryzae]TDV40740.1 hypothetical protein CLV71_122130 [Actinophytocola oryzae]